MVVITNSEKENNQYTKRYMTRLVFQKISQGFKGKEMEIKVIIILNTK